MIKKTEKIDNNKELDYVGLGTGIVFIGKIYSNVILILYGIIIARIVGARLLGIYYLGLSITGIFTQIGTLGLHKGILRYIGIFYERGNYQAIRKTAYFIIRLVVSLCFLLSLALMMVSKAISLHIFHQPDLAFVLIILSISIPFSAFENIAFSTLQSIRKVKYKVFIQDILLPSTRLLSSIILFIVGWRLDAIILSYLISIILCAFTAGYVLYRFFGNYKDSKSNEVDEISIRQIIKFSMPFYASQFLTNIPIRRIIIWVLGIYCSMEIVAVYGVINRLRRSGRFVLNSFSSITAPIISGLHNTGKLRELEELYKVTTRWIISLSIPIYILIIILSHDFLKIYGRHFITGTNALIILCIAEMLCAVVGMAGSMVTMSGNSIFSLINGLIVFIFASVLSITLIPKYGLTGAAFSAAIPVVFINQFRLVTAYYYLKMQPYEWSYIKPIISVIIASLILLGILHVSHIPLPYSIIIYSMLFFIIYLSIIYIIGLELEDKRLLKQAGFWIYNNFRRKRQNVVL